ncbi:hypothetical protein ACS3UN_03365 [Oscillospiraceae bacterium LTW-04]|nr:hypothetical protein RBH76_07100 [Oscillospiraceae bacterium MB24-C1]
MKKFFALAMAAAMIASMSATSFAADIITGTPDGPFTKKTDDGKLYYPVVAMHGPFSYDADDKVLTDETVEYGETAYYALLQSDIDSKGNPSGDKSLVTESEVVSNLKVKPKWEEGSKLVKSVSIVKKKVTNEESATGDNTGRYYKYGSDGKPTTASENEYNSGDAFMYADELFSDNYDYEKPEAGKSTSGNYYYFLAIAMESTTSTADTDVIGTLTLSKSKAPKIDDLELDISLNVDWANSYRSSTSYVIDGSSSPELEDETYYSLKFDYDDETDLEFEDGSIFTVDVSGQGKLLVYYDTDFKSKVASKYPLAELNFWNGNGAKFNRVGEMFLACDEDYAQFLYQLNADGTLSEVPGAEFDKYDEGFYFNTRVLGTYVISDMDLELEDTTVETPTVETPDVPTTPVPPVTNPSTGAVA